MRSSTQSVAVVSVYVGTEAGRSESVGVGAYELLFSGCSYFF